MREGEPQSFLNVCRAVLPGGVRAVANGLGMERFEVASGESVAPEWHTQWALTKAIRSAKANCDRVKLKGGRPGDLFFNREFALSDGDRQSIAEIVGANVAESAETRSRVIKLATPIGQHCGRSVRPLTSAQLKGVVFDRGQPLREYDGVGWRPEYYFADRSGVFCRFHPGHDPVGCCVLSEAVREFCYTRRAYPLGIGTECEVPAPLAWAHFEGMTWEGEDLGCVVLALPDLPGDRGDTDWYAALDRILGQGDFAPMGELQARRAHALCLLHRRGLVAPFRIFANVTFASEFVLMHDLGDRRALARDEMFSDAQFEAEAFCNLVFLIGPIDQIPERACRHTEAKRVIVDRAADFTRAITGGYFGAAVDHSLFTFDALEAVYREGFERPFGEIRAPVAEAFRAQLWMESPRPLLGNAVSRSIAR